MGFSGAHRRREYCKNFITKVSKLVHNLWTGNGQFLRANGPPFPIPIRENICEQCLAFAVVGLFDYGAIHNARVAVDPYVQIFETLLRTLAADRMLALKLKVLFLCNDCPRHNVQEIRSEDALESYRIVFRL